jgi:hypothetical protein
VYALEAATGVQLWNFTTGGDVASSPAVAEGIVYVGSYDGKVYALDASEGSLIWSYQTDDLVVSSPAAAEGVVYVGSYDHAVYAFGLIDDPEENMAQAGWRILLLVSIVIAGGALIAFLLDRRKKKWEPPCLSIQDCRKT